MGGVSFPNTVGEIAEITYKKERVLLAHGHRHACFRPVATQNIMEGACGGRSLLTSLVSGKQGEEGLGVLDHLQGYTSQ
jgi:hypothetical protein